MHGVPNLKNSKGTFTVLGSEGEEVCAVKQNHCILASQEDPRDLASFIFPCWASL